MKPPSSTLFCAVLVAGTTLPAACVQAQTATPGPPLPAAPEQRQAEPGTETPAPQGEGPGDRANLLGNPGGVRSRLEARGLTLSLSETSEVQGNPTGGRRRAVTYSGLTRFGLQLDTERAIGLPGGTFRVGGFQIHGRGLTGGALGGDLFTVSNIEESPGWLLTEFWYEQAFVEGRVTVRAGQLFADLEFMTSTYAGSFIAATFGWTAYATNALPNGGPIYPRAGLGIRVQAQVAEAWTILAGAFNGDPSGPERVDGQRSNRSGTAFRLDDGVFAITEVQYALNGSEGATGLPGVYKLGGWYHSGRFGDPQRGSDGLPLADPFSNGRAAARRGNWSIYAVADQFVWREKGTRDQGVGVFARIMGGPGDRTLLNFYVDAGVTYKGVVPGRVNDTLALGVAHARFSDRVSKADRDAARFGSPRPVRRSETVLELTYQAVVTPWWQVQPMTQYIFRPSGEANPNRPGRRLLKALVMGMRMNFTF